MTIGLDTSVVVRLLVGLPEEQVRAARQRLDTAYAAGDTVLVSDLVIAETFHVLRHHYAISDAVIRSRMSAFLRSGLVQPDPAGCESVFDETGLPGLVDRLIHLHYREHYAVLLTFDRRQARLEGAEVVG